MIIDKTLMDTLTRQAQESPRLRMNMDLRNSSADQSQRMLNALEPGTRLPIHRHRFSSESLAVIRGSIRQNFYDDEGKLTESVVVKPGSDIVGIVVEKGRWHNTESLESGTVIYESKDGAYMPISPEDVME